MHLKKVRNVFLFQMNLHHRSLFIIMQHYSAHNIFDKINTCYIINIMDMNLNSESQIVDE